MREDVRLAITGDRQAFGRLVRETYPVVSAIALAITRDAQRSADVAQDVFLAAWLGLRRLRNVESFLPWLRQLTRHVARSAVRAEARWARRWLSGEAAERALTQLADPGERADDVLTTAEEREALREALDALPDEARDCVILYYSEEMSTAQVAELLGISPVAARKRLERARRSLEADVMRRLGETLRRTRAGAGAIAAICGALGVAPSAASAAALTGGAASTGGLAVGALVGSVGGAAIGLASTFRRIASVARSLRGSRRVVVGYVVTAAAFAVLLGVVLPLARPTGLWLWFIAYRATDAIVRFVWLPRRGVSMTRRATLRWVAVVAVGTMAVAWADAQVRS